MGVSRPTQRNRTAGNLSPLHTKSQSILTKQNPRSVPAPQTLTDRESRMFLITYAPAYTSVRYRAVPIIPKTVIFVTLIRPYAKTFFNSYFQIVVRSYLYGTAPSKSTREFLQRCCRGFSIRILRAYVSRNTFFAMQVAPTRLFTES